MLRRDHRVVAWTLFATASAVVVPVFAAGALRAAPAPVADGAADAPAAVVDATASETPSATPSESPTPTPSQDPAPSQPPATTQAPAPPEPQPSDPAPTADPTGPASPSATASTTVTATPTEQPTSTPTPGEPVPSTPDGLTFSYDVTDGLAGPTGTCSVTAEPAAPADASAVAGGDPAAATADTGATTTPVAIACLSVTKYQRTGSQVRFSGAATQGGKPTSYSITVVDGRGTRPDSFLIETSKGFVGGGSLTGGSLKVR